MTKIGWLIVLLLAAGLFGSLLLAIKENQSTTIQRAEQGCSNSEACSAYGVYQETRAADANEAMVWLTVWQFVAGLAGLYVVARTLRATLAAVTEAKEATEAARLSVEIAQKTLQNDRAWMTWSATETVKTPEGGLKIYCVWENTGRTPALDVRCTVVVVGRAPEFPVPEPDLDIADSRKGPVGSGKTTTTAILTLSPEDWRGVQNGTSILYVFSQASYLDIFSEERRESVISTRVVFQGEKVHDRTGEVVPLIQHLFVGDKTRNT